MSNILKYIFIAAGIILIILIFRWWRCKNGCSVCSGQSRIAKPSQTDSSRGVECSFWTGKEIKPAETANAGTGKVSNQAGAVVYIKTSEGMETTGKTISYGQQVKYTAVVTGTICDPNSQICLPPSDFYKLTDGTFLSKADVTIIMTK